jgi:hypothetical protein
MFCGPGIGVEVTSGKTGKVIAREAVLDIEFATPPKQIAKWAMQTINASPDSSVRGVTQVINTLH